MGEAKRRGDFEERKAKAIALRTAYCGKRVKSSRFGDRHCRNEAKKQRHREKMETRGETVSATEVAL